MDFARPNIQFQLQQMKKNDLQRGDFRTFKAMS